MSNSDTNDKRTEGSDTMVPQSHAYLVVDPKPEKNVLGAATESGLFVFWLKIGHCDVNFWKSAAQEEYSDSNLSDNYDAVAIDYTGQISQDTTLGRYLEREVFNNDDCFMHPWDPSRAGFYGVYRAKQEDAELLQQGLQKLLGTQNPFAKEGITLEEIIREFHSILYSKNGAVDQNDKGKSPETKSTYSYLEVQVQPSVHPDAASPGYFWSSHENKIKYTYSIKVDLYDANALQELAEEDEGDCTNAYYASLTIETPKGEEKIDWLGASFPRNKRGEEIVLLFDDITAALDFAGKAYLCLEKLNKIYKITGKPDEGTKVMQELAGLVKGA